MRGLVYFRFEVAADPISEVILVVSVVDVTYLPPFPMRSVIVGLL